MALSSILLIIDWLFDVEALLPKKTLWYRTMNFVAKQLDKTNFGRISDEIEKICS